MNERQRQLIEYFNSLRDPTPPVLSEPDTEENITESVPPPPKPTIPPRPTVESVRGMLEKRRSAAFDIEELIHSEDIEETLPSPAAADSLLRRPEPLERTVTDHVIEVAMSATEKALNDQEMDLEEEDIFEAIILPGKRPVLDVVNGDISDPPPGWEFLADYRELIKRTLPAVGRIDVPELLTVPYAGTGFFVGDGVLMTNRHVARLFVQGVGQGKKYLTFQTDRTALFDPKYEVGATGSGAGGDRYEVVEALLVHPHWDAALLRVRAAEGKVLPQPLKLVRQPPPDFAGGAWQHVIVVGYPMLDTRRNDATEIEQQMNIFRKIFGRKRLMPGYMNGYRDVVTKWKATLQAATHDASTLGGNSGSAVIDLTTGTVLSLHFGGRYLQTNFGVPAWELARDAKLEGLGVNFVDYPGTLSGGGRNTIDVSTAPEWLKAWEGLQPLTLEEASEPGDAVQTPRAAPPFAPPGTPVLPVAPDWFERISDAELVEAMRRDSATTERLIRETLMPHEAEDLIADLRWGLQPTQALTEEEGVFDFLLGGPKTDPWLPEIIFLHGIMGGHLAAYGSLGGRVWLSPLAFAAGKVADRLALTEDGERDRISSRVLYPDGHLRLVYEKAARKWRMGGFVVHEFAYDWRKPIANSADRLHLFIESVRLERPAKRFALVCHSMGGLVAALYAARHPEWSGRIAQAIFLGSPLRGSYAPVEALLGTYPLFPKFALVDRLDDSGDYAAMARTLPGLLDMLPDPDLFPDAAPLYQRVTWPESSAPAQVWLDQSRQLKRLLANSPILETASLMVSSGHPTVSEVGVVGGKLQPGRRNRPGDGTVPTRSAAGVPGDAVYSASFSHGDLPREPGVIAAVADLLKNGRCDLPRLSQQAIEDVAPIEEAVTESLEEAVVSDLSLRLRSGILTQRDVDFLLRTDHATLPGPVGHDPGAGGV